MQSLDAEEATMELMALANPEPSRNPPVSRDELTDWDFSIYTYEREAAAEAGFAVGSIKVEGGYRLLVIDAARSVNVESGPKTEKWGYGYRLLVEVNNVDTIGSLTLPAIAASVELRQAEAQVRLRVNGWVGDSLWGKLPAPKPLGVDSYREFLEVADQIQESFGRHPEMAVPVKLAEGDTQTIAADGVTSFEIREAVALTIMLNLARQGASPEEMSRAVLAHTDMTDMEAGRLAQALHLSLEDGDPTGQRRKELASSLIDPLRQGGFDLP